MHLWHWTDLSTLPGAKKSEFAPFVWTFMKKFGNNSSTSLITLDWITREVHNPEWVLRVCLGGAKGVDEKGEEEWRKRKYGRECVQMYMEVRLLVGGGGRGKKEEDEVDKN